MLLWLWTSFILTILASAGLEIRHRNRNAQRRRLAALIRQQPAPSDGDGTALADMRRRVQKLAEAPPTGLKAWTLRLAQRAGMEISPLGYWMLTAAVVIALGALLIGPARLQIPMALSIALAFGAGLPWFVLSLLAARRQNAFTTAFADATDAIVRNIKAGLSLGEALRMVGREMPPVVADVFRKLGEEQDLGVPLDQALTRAAERVGTPEMRFFAVVLSIQRQTGGNLAETLGNLSGLLRSRKKLRDRVKALSAEARASAAIIGSMPFIIAGLLWLTSPDYLDPLFDSSGGRALLVAGLVWMAIGAFVMRRMVDLRI
ncbi:type II secretion system F family protein [Lacibacterium aquatile]|uniref:Type II secretion system F family protein n=1 Tax=Lacibacterium aquatile TaxID=1168082 RepID=A0ABW5DTG0_9PROT